MRIQAPLLALSLAVTLALTATPAASRDRAPGRFAPTDREVAAAPADATALLAAVREAARARDWQRVIDLGDAWRHLAVEAGPDAEIALLTLGARAFDELGRFDEREDALRDVVDLQRAHAALDDPTDGLRGALNLLAWHVHRVRPGDPESAALLHEAVDLARADPHAGPADLAAQRTQLGQLLANVGDPAGALDAFGAALADWERSAKPSDAQRAHLLGRMGYATRALGRADDAIDAFERQLAIVDATRGAGHPDALASLTPLAQLLLDADRPDAAASHARRGIELASTAWGADSRRTLVLRRQLDRAERRLGTNDHATAPTTAPAYDGLAPTGDARLRARARALETEGTAATARGDFERAEALFADAATLRREAAAGAESWELARVVRQQAWLADTRGRADTARRAFVEAAEMTERVLGPTHPAGAEAWRAVGRFHAGRGDTAAAAESYAAALAVWERAGRESPEAATLRRELATALRSLARTDDAARLLDESIAAWERLAGPDAPESTRDMAALAGLLAQAGRYDEATRLAEDVLRRTDPAAAARIAPLYVLARVHAELGRPVEARAALDEALALERAWNDTAPDDLARTLRRYAAQYARLGFPDDAATLTAEADALQPGG